MKEYKNVTRAEEQKQYDNDNQKRILQIVKKIREKYKPEKIILFGSFACGRPTRHSDVDLLIIKRTKARHIDRAVKIREIIEEENRLVAIEPLVYTPEEVEKRLKMEDDFVRTIIRKGVVLYG